MFELGQMAVFVYVFLVLNAIILATLLTIHFYV